MTPIANRGGNMAGSHILDEFLPEMYEPFLIQRATS